jgi:hypothetical protein
MWEKPMKASLVVAALTLLAGAPFAQAFQSVQSSNVPAATAPRVADPEDIRDSIANQGTAGGTATTPFGTQLRIGTPSGTGGSDATIPFLQSPATRRVPPQRQ